MLKKLITFSLFVAITASTYSQVVSDSVTLGASYNDQVFYQLSTGNKTTADASQWDLQFFSDLFSASIRVNSGFDVELYRTGNTDTANFTSSTLDTSSLTIMRDGLASWETDAFTTQQTGHPNYGWGNYRGLGNIVGNRVYAIKLSSGVFKKIWMKEFRTNGTLTFAVADLDGSNEVTKTLNRSTYSTKRHFYYDVENDSTYDSEPMRTQWELVFRKYADQAGPIVYSVSGALSNHGLAIAQVSNTDITTAKNNWNNHAYDSTIGVIGWDWKTFDRFTNTWNIEDSLSFIMKDYNGDVYQLVFTGTSGASTGKMFFTKEKFSLSSIEENSPVANIGVFPNPTNGQLTVNFELNNSTQPADIFLMDMNGRIVQTVATQFAQSGFNQIRTDISDLKSGVYLLQVRAGDKFVTRRIVKQ